MDRNLALEAVRVTEWAALSAYQWVGRGDEHAADQAAVQAMRQALNGLDIVGTVVIGEGARDKAPMLYCGEKVGNGQGPALDIALDPLEGTTITAQGGFNAMTVIALASKGSFLHAPDVYMQKIACGQDVPASAIALDASPAENIQNVAKAKGINAKDVVVCILNRPRHADIIAAVRAIGCRIMLIQDGDVAAVIAAAQPDNGIDLYMGTGGAPEGVLAAAALACIGGHMQTRLLFANDTEREQAKATGINNFDKIYQRDDLARGDQIMFAATGVTDGPLLAGIRRQGRGATSQSLVMRAQTGTSRLINASHNFSRKPFQPSI